MLIQGARRPLEVNDDMLAAINSGLRAMKIDDRKIFLDRLSFKYSFHASFLRKTIGECAPPQQRSDEGLIAAKVTPKTTVGGTEAPKGPHPTPRSREYVTVTWPRGLC